MPASNVTINSDTVHFEAFDVHETTYHIDRVSRRIRFTYGAKQSFTLQFGTDRSFDKWCLFCETTLEKTP